jgi:hypothetical protein
VSVSGRVFIDWIAVPIAWVMLIILAMGTPWVVALCLAAGALYVAVSLRRRRRTHSFAIAEDSRRSFRIDDHRERRVAPNLTERSERLRSRVGVRPGPEGDGGGRSHPGNAQTGGKHPVSDADQHSVE